MRMRFADTVYTEQQIRGLAINFLRQHYRLRPRSGTSGTRVVHRPHYYQGAKIDALLAYQKPDKEWFTATVEATGLQEPEEVRYRVNWFRITVDSLLLGLLILVVFLAQAQVRGTIIWRQLGDVSAPVYLLAMLLIATGLFVVFLSRLREYRYIYAVAQFKRFFADAQWVAYDAAIFDDKPGGRYARWRYGGRNPYLRELERQCLVHGFGLLEIRPDNQVVDRVEPSHLDYFRGSRRRLPRWLAAAAQTPPLLRGLVGGRKVPLLRPAASPPAVTEADREEPPAPVATEYADPLAVEAYLPERSLRPAEVLLPAAPTPGRPAWYRRPARRLIHLRWRLREAGRSLYPDEIRRRPGYYDLGPLRVAGLSVLLPALLLLGYLQYHRTQNGLPNERPASLAVEQLEPVKDPAASDATPYVLDGEYDHELTRREAAVFQEDLNLTPEPIVEAGTASETDILAYRYDSTGLVATTRTCGALVRTGDLAYLLAEGRYPLLPAAQARATAIARAYNLPANVVVADCLEEGRPGYVLYLGGLFLEAAEASLYLRRYQQRYDLDLTVEVVE